MIYVKMDGRLGNQLFGYAFARAVQVKRGKLNEKIVLFWDKQTYSGMDGVENSLKYFACANNYESIVTNRFRIDFLRHASFMQKLLFLGRHCLLKLGFRNNNTFKKLLNRHGISSLYGDCYQFYVPVEFSDCENILIRGYHFSEKYFSEIREILLKDFTPLQQELPENSDLYQKIRSTNSVCVTIRRGDFLTPECARFNVCSKQYFLKAMQIMREKMPDVNYFIFSDDIEWCKANINFDAPLSFETGNDPVWEKLRLMYSCKHFILSNSTFSWWAQYLSTSKDKTVIAPQQWFVPNIKHDYNNPSWISIDALALK